MNPSITDYCVCDICIKPLLPTEGKWCWIRDERKWVCDTCYLWYRTPTKPEDSECCDVCLEIVASRAGALRNTPEGRYWVCDECYLGGLNV